MEIPNLRQFIRSLVRETLRETDDPFGNDVMMNHRPHKIRRTQDPVKGPSAAEKHYRVSFSDAFPDEAYSGACIMDDELRQLGAHVKFVEHPRLELRISATANFDEIAEVLRNALEGDPNVTSAVEVAIP